MSILILPVPELPRIAVAVQIPTLPEPSFAASAANPAFITIPWSDFASRSTARLSWSARPSS